MKRLVFLVFCLFALCGCEFQSGDELLQPPRPSATYESLQKQINQITADGAIRVSPQSGENRNTVQLTDLDLDGEDEAVAFFCETKNPDRFHVYVFQRENEEYIAIGTVTGTGVQINSVSYPYLAPSGKKGILISWKLSGDDSTMGMTVCAFVNGTLTTLLETTYQSFITCDLDDNGTDDLVLFSKDESGRRIAQLYVCNGEKLEKKGEAVLSPETQSIVSLKSGLLRGYQPAVFVESKLAISAGLMTDIFVYDTNGFRNLVLEGEEEIGTYRSVSVPSSDVNQDQVTEVPMAIPTITEKHTTLPEHILDTSAYLLDWYAYSTGDAPVRVCTTYQNISENWQFMLPEAWRGSVSVAKSSQENRTITIFSDCMGEQAIPILYIHRLTGDMREYYATQDGMIELTRTQTEIYTASIPETAAQSTLTVTEQQIRERFSTISQTWS